MFQRALIIAGFITLIVLCGPAAGASDGWRLEMDKNGIKAYSRGMEGSPIQEVRAVAIIDAPLETVGEVARDIASYPLWVPFCSEGEILEREDRNNMTVHIYLNLPWPVSDRDITPKATTEYDLEHARAIVDIENTDLAACPPMKGVVRMPKFQGKYVFEYVTRDKTGVIYTYNSDLGGSFPVFLANIFAKQNMYKTFRGLQETVKLPKFQELGAASPDRDLINHMVRTPEIFKKVLVARLREFVGSDAFVDLLASGPELIEIMNDNDGCIAQILLYGWGSTESKMEGIREVLRAYMAKRNVDEEAIEAAVDNEALIKAILTGNEAEVSVSAVLSNVLAMQYSAVQ